MDNNKIILNQAETLYNAKSIGEKILGNSANLVFEVEVEQVPFILRVSEYGDKRKTRMDFELNWVNYLAENLDNVVKPIKSLNNNYYEIIQANNNYYILCLFEKANGKITDYNNPTEFNDNLFFDLGVLMGNIHKLTIEFDGNIIKPGFEWHDSKDDTTFQDINTDIQTFEQKYYNEILALPASKTTYGIIHSDIHIHNFFVDKGHIKLFDFENCRFDWYANDIATTLFSMLLVFGISKPERERTEFAEAYLIAFLKGYTQTHIINKYWIAKLDLFMRYSMIVAYKFVQNRWKNKPTNPMQENLNWYKNRIINDLPFVFIDYNKIIENL